MILGLSTSTFLLVHVALSLVGIASGLVAFYGMLAGKKLAGWTEVFLATTILTSLTGFPLPPFGFDPPRVVGLISLVLLGLAAVALYDLRLAGVWRWIYVATAVAALYLNVFVAVVQSFQKLAFLKPLAPTQSEPPFVVAQLAALATFVILGIMAARHFNPAAKVMG